ncbi:hypothetical protein GpartN1_g5230.t1 [Galdieria partita]|uniref:Uncharacterized protein n=1 Tax=Galdieria partita TaxID=83374 RepID=A0A9C7PZI7_9RHOD|nr:hypothetical protein GpartN1_g5230.t1 [Galdieria partita]
MFFLVCQQYGIASFLRLKRNIQSLNNSKLSLSVSYNKVPRQHKAVMKTSLDDSDDTNVSSVSFLKKTSPSMLLRLQEEAQAPFRKFRMFIYGGAFFSALIGLLISSSQLLSGIIGSHTAYPVRESVDNMLINGIVIVTASVLYFYDYQAGKQRLGRLSVLTDIRTLPIEYNERHYLIEELERKHALVIIAATGEQLQTILAQLKNISTKMEKFIVVPFVVNISTLPLWEQFDDCKWLGKASNVSFWHSWYRKEREFVPKNKANEPIVLVLRKNGKFGFRGYGNPNWAEWLSSFNF